MTSRTTATTAEVKISRKESELLCIIRLGYAVSHAADGMQHVNAEFFLFSPDEHLDSVSIAVEVLVIEVFNQFGARNNLAAVVHERG